MLEWSDLEPILRAVRHDLIQTSRFFGTAYENPPDPLRAALHCVFGTADPATDGFAERYREWERFAPAPSMACMMTLEVSEAAL